MNPEEIENRFKYPRTIHLPWSPGAHHDDIVGNSVPWQPGDPVVITEKMDGENTTIYRGGVTARSLETAPHPSRDWVRALHGSFAQDIPLGWRLCGENLFARHSLGYDDLPSYFLLFSVWTEKNVCLSWSDTREWAELLGLHTVPELYVEPWDERLVRELAIDSTKMEGYVVRSAAGFAFEDFQKNVSKWVRRAHVQTDERWLQKTVIANGLAKGR